MEVALEPGIPTYSGGLGVLAGDTLRSAADLGVAMVGVTLLHRKGYFEQRIDPEGNQSETPVDWQPEDCLEPLDATVVVTIEGRLVHVRAWRYLVQGAGGHVVPVYLLDTRLEENIEQDRAITDYLYGGDEHYRLCQEVVLGVAGLAMLRRLGHHEIATYHMNEGHSALLALCLLEDVLTARKASLPEHHDIDVVRKRCIFTTHTPVPAGHDRFSSGLVSQILGPNRAHLLEAAGACKQGTLNMTQLALQCSNYVNGVAKFHSEVSRAMFPQYQIRAVTNGVHAVTWTSQPFQELYDRHVPEWRHDNIYLRYALDIPLEEIQEAHAHAKRALLAEVERVVGRRLDETVMTIGFARRATPYKRADLLLHSPDRLRWIARNVGPLQLIYGGKAHPRDEGGKQIIRQIHRAADELKGVIEVVYVENYDMAWGKLITSGVDLWLNTPQKTREASGTSGMKAALNGVPSLSVLDGWWIEGHLSGVTGWSIGNSRSSLDDHLTVAHSLYDKLERVVLAMFYRQPAAYADVMRSAIALNGSFFNTQRMVSQYVFNAYLKNGNR